MNIQAEFEKIENEIRKVRTDIKNDFNRRGLLNSGFPDNEIFQKTMELLECRLVQLITQHGYHRQKYRKSISNFLNQQTSYLIKNIVHQEQKEASRDIIEGTSEKLKIRIANRISSVQVHKRHEWIKFWIPVSVSITALVVSIFVAIYGRNGS